MQILCVMVLALTTAHMRLLALRFASGICNLFKKKCPPTTWCLISQSVFLPTLSPSGAELSAMASNGKWPTWEGPLGCRHSFLPSERCVNFRWTRTHAGPDRTGRRASNWLASGSCNTEFNDKSGRQFCCMGCGGGHKEVKH